MSLVLVIGKVWPEPASSAAGSRMMEIIRVFLSHKYDVVFASAANDSAFMADLESIGVKKKSIQLNDVSFDSFVKELNPAIVLFDRFTSEEQFGWRVAEQCPHALRILDTEDLHCLRAARHKAFKEKRDFNEVDLVSDIAKREIASIYRCDLSLIISSVEMKILTDYFKVDASLLYYLPFLLEKIIEENEKRWPDFSERSGFISIGNFLHEPNWDAVLYLKQEIWPLIRKKLPKAELFIYGAYPSHKVFDLHNPKEGFLIKGRAEDAKEVMSKARVCIAPLRFGAGIKGKLADAMVCGTPNVTTDIGAEAMKESLAWSGEIKNSAAEIAEAAVELYVQEDTWKEAQQRGITLINTLFAKENFEEDFISAISNLQKNLDEHRLKNFTGAMLMQHTALSSRYMALWIEAKNKRD
ncbi:glycosyltransferase [Sphingobacteriaceae bacterium]|nr:glycosyltransferase [Sphingobacteriaceae bacterium]